MNCDDVFDALTDPALSDSAALDEHLAHCPRCRQMQQVLEPARTLLCGDLPTERGLSEGSSTETPAANRPAPLLSVEAVGLAETIAAQLASANGKSATPSHRPFARRTFVVGALRSAALVLFGALAVYCLSSREGGSDSQSLPGVVPGVGPAKTCTRLELQKKGQGPQDARRVILSCVGCHMHDGLRRQPPTSTSLFWPPRRPVGSVSLARGEMSDRPPMETSRLAAETRLS
jgi:hypothetical protein